MPKFRFTIGGLMAVVVAAAVGLAAVARPNHTWAGIMLLVAYGLLGLAILGVVIRRQAARAWWIGWAVFEWGYLQLSMSSYAWMWGLLSRGLPTLKLLEMLRGKPVAAQAISGGMLTSDEVATNQVGHCVWAIVAGFVGAALAQALFAMPHLPVPGSPSGSTGRKKLLPKKWLRPIMTIALLVPLVVAVVAIWSTPDARLWAGGMYLLTCAILGIATLAAFFSRGKTREVSIGAALFGAGYLYMAMTYSRFPTFEHPRPLFITNEFLYALRSRIPWGTRGMTSADGRVLKALEQPIAMQKFKDAPLEQVLAHIKMATSTTTEPGIQFYVDPIGLQEAEKTLESTVSIDLKGVPLKTTLRLCLKQLGLAYTVEDGCVNITSAEQFSEIPPADDPFLVVGHSLLSLVAAALGGLAALLVSTAFRRRSDHAA